MHTSAYIQTGTGGIPKPLFAFREDQNMQIDQHFENEFFTIIIIPSLV
jgi:hypothetical protein